MRMDRAKPVRFVCSITGQCRCPVACRWGASMRNSTMTDAQRDYFWNLSRAINMAKDRIYIHDWWWVLCIC